MRTAILDGMIQFLSTPSARRATAKRMKAKIRHWISIHALREEGDSHDPTMKARFSQFLSTPSARRATCRCAGKRTAIGYFYPRPPRGGRRRDEIIVIQLDANISIHALREEGDSAWTAAPPSRQNFYPRPPRGGRPEIDSYLEETKLISIHALREEGDGLAVLSPYSPAKFLSTPSARRATRRPLRLGCLGRYFYPRPPRGGRQQKQRQNLYFQTNYTTFCTNLEEL